MNHKLARLAHQVRIGGLFFALTFCAQASAQPRDDLIIINGFPPGAIVDTAGRLVSSHLDGFNNVIMENKPGASGAVAGAHVARAEPDGKTLLFIAFSSLITAKAGGKAGVVDLTEELVPVAYIGGNTSVLLVRKDLPVNNFYEFVAYAKAHPGQLNFGTNGVGGSYHLGLEQLKAQLSIDINHVPYKGSAPGMQDMLGGRLDAMFATISIARPHLDAGKLKAIALTNGKRAKQLPNLPTIAESGVPDYTLDGGMGVFAPPGTHTETVQTLNVTFNKALEKPEVADRLGNEGVMISPMSPKKFKAYLDAEVEKARTIIQSLGLSL